jgi:uncharacterized membrane protein YczE
MLLGLVLLAAAIVISVRAGLGVAPWDVLHEGLADRTGLDFGTVVVIVGFGAFLFWIPLREKPGIGTAINVVLVGVLIDLMLPVVPEPEALAVRIAMLVAALALFGISVGMYVGAGLGAGPRDGLMTGIAARGLPLWLVRTIIEVGVLILGYALGGTVGIGTVVLAFGTGPIAHAMLRVFRVREPVEQPTGIGMAGD